MLLGALINGLLIAVGTTFGLILKKGIKESYQSSIIKALGLVVMFLAITGFSAEASTMNVLLSVVIGTLFGELVDLDGKVNKLGAWIQSKFKNVGEVARGFVDGTLLFCVGGMAIIGAFQSALLNDHSTQILKGIIDMVVACFMAAQAGVGVYFSGISVFLYQGVLTVFASLFGDFLTGNALAMMQLTNVGSLVLLTVGMNMAEIGKFKSMNMLPAILVAVILALFGI